MTMSQLGQIAFRTGAPAFGWKLFGGASVNRALFEGAIMGGGNAIGFYAVNYLSMTKEWDKETKKIAVFAAIFFTTMAAYYAYKQVDPKFNYESELRGEALSLVISYCFSYYFGWGKE